MQPVITYTNKEVGTNPELRSTTLQSLGLAGGNGLLRLFHRFTTVPLQEYLDRDKQVIIIKKNQIIKKKKNVLQDK